MEPDKFQHGGAGDIHRASGELVALNGRAQVFEQESEVWSFAINGREVAFGGGDGEALLQLLVKGDFLDEVLQHDAGGAACFIIRGELAYQAGGGIVGLAGQLQFVANAFADLPGADAFCCKAGHFDIMSGFVELLGQPSIVDGGFGRYRCHVCLPDIQPSETCV